MTLHNTGLSDHTNLPCELGNSLTKQTNLLCKLLKVILSIHTSVAFQVNPDKIKQQT